MTLCYYGALPEQYYRQYRMCSARAKEVCTIMTIRINNNSHARHCHLYVFYIFLRINISKRSDLYPVPTRNGTSLPSSVLVQPPLVTG